jgi:hypothetical protein
MTIGFGPALRCSISYFGMTEAVLAHKFRIGDNVHFTTGLFGRGGANGVYEVVRLLPSEGDEQQYRIKSVSEPHERVAKQSQLERAA